MTTEKRLGYRRASRVSGPALRLDRTGHPRWRTAERLHGPFVAGSRIEIAELYRGFRNGEFTSMHEVARLQHQHNEGRQSWVSQ